MYFKNIEKVNLKDIINKSDKIYAHIGMGKKKL